ncbi:MAG: type 4a pilus biogenesis protein PilO [Acidobacteria bacterium]|nr:type 4a pilus biogenesis protein PilO [Acidobacteriota bacterium]
MADNPLSKLPLAGQLGVSLVLAGVIGGVFYWQWWSPKDAEETAKKAELAKLGDEIRALEVIRNKQQEFLREVEQRKAKLDLLKRILPADKETPELMKKVQYLATQADLQIKKFNPGATVTKQFDVPGPGTAAGPGRPGAPAPPRPPARPGAPGAAAAPPQDSYQEWPINVEIEGTYHNLGMFLDRVSRLSRLVNVGNLKVKNMSQPKRGRTISVACVATTFVYVEAPRPAAPPAAAAAPAGGARP